MHKIFIAISAIIIFSCNEKEEINFAIQHPIKDLASKSGMLEKLKYRESVLDEFSTPVIVNREDGLVIAKTAKMKGAKCRINDEIEFMLVTIDYNQNDIFDSGDEMLISAIEDDSILVNINPFSIKNKNPILVKFLEKIYMVKVDDSISNVSIEKQQSQTYDIEYPCIFPNLDFIDMETNEVQIISNYIKPKRSLLLIATSENCNYCYNQFSSYVNSGQAKNDMDIVLIFANNANNIAIDNYKKIIPKNITYDVAYLKGNLSKFMKTYGLVTFPDAVLFNDKGLILKNHYTLNKVEEYRY